MLLRRLSLSQSFKVIVGSNGSGKSTILKLITRLYDPTEGEILIDGRDIRSLKLTDLRNAVSVLFQDYTHFPLSVRDTVVNHHNLTQSLRRSQLTSVSVTLQMLMMRSGFNKRPDWVVRKSLSINSRMGSRRI